MASIDWGIVLDLSDQTSDNNAAIGMAAGIIYWVTGRPGYAGSGYTGEAPAGKIWKQGIITKDSISDIVRIAEGIHQTGGYGTLSGVEFGVDNAPVYDYGGNVYPWWDFLARSEYEVINRPVSVYCFLDDVSFLVWKGAVSKTQYDANVFRFICEDAAVHKTIPPRQITRDAFPGAEEKNMGAVIPVCIGDVRRALNASVYRQQNPIVLMTYPEERTVAALHAYNSLTRTITLYTAGRTFQQNELRGLYARAAVNGGNQSINILGNDATVKATSELEDTTVFYLATWFDDPPEAQNALISVGTTTDIWYFQVLDFSGSNIISTKEIYGFVASDKGLPAETVYYDGDKADYVDISHVVNDYNTVSINNRGLPGINITDRKLDASGNIAHLFTLLPEYVEYQGHALVDVSQDTVVTAEPTFGERLGFLIDRATADSHDVTWTATALTRIAIDFKLRVPPEILEGDYDTFFIVCDFSYQTDAGTNNDLNVTSSFTGIDCLGKITPEIKSGSIYDAAAIVPGADRFVNLIPGVHYNVTRDETNLYSIISLIDISDFISSGDVLEAFPSILHRMVFTLVGDFSIPSPGESTGATIKFREMCFAATKKVNIVSDEIYTAVRGEVL